MVALDEIKARNAHLDQDQYDGLVAVFAGATAGIGWATLQRIASMVRSSTIYVLGRSDFSTKIAILQKLSPSSKFVYIKSELSLIASVDEACEQILAAEKEVDFLFMSQGFFPFQGASYTKEDLELFFSLSYYSRLRLVSNLLPLLQRSSRARVVAVLRGTQEHRINEKDVALEKKWTIPSALHHATLCTSLAFNYLAARDGGKIAYIHDTPGIVSSGMPVIKRPSDGRGTFWLIILSILQVLLPWLMRVIGFSLQESGERHAYYLTSDKYPAGSLQTDKWNEIVPSNKVLRDYQSRGWDEKIWEHTQRTWDKALTKGTTTTKR